MLDGEILSPQRVEDLSRIPDKKQLLGHLAGTFQAPLSQLACATRDIYARVVYALEAHRKKLEEGGGKEAAGAET